jgi:predicted nucleic acid-binding protein
LVNLVIDASAGFELILETVAGQSLLAKVPSTAEWWAPEHYYVEVAGAIRRAEYRGAITRAQTTAPFDRLRAGHVHRVQIRLRSSTRRW